MNMSQIGTISGSKLNGTRPARQIAIEGVLQILVASDIPFGESAGISKNL